MKHAYAAFRSQRSFHSPGQTAVVPLVVGLPSFSDRNIADIDLELGSPPEVGNTSSPQEPTLPRSRGRRPHCPAFQNQGPHRRGAPETLKCWLSANTSTFPTVGRPSSKVQEGTAGPERAGRGSGGQKMGAWILAPLLLSCGNSGLLQLRACVSSYL